MRKKIILFAVILILFCSGCSTLNISDINSQEKRVFKSLQLEPDIEPNNLRIDLIRHTYQENETDSTYETKQTPYHPLGLNLGNGLFFDLNGNLSLRVDYLLKFSEKSDFEIMKISRPEKNKGMIKYSFCNDSLKISYPPKIKIYNKYHISGSADSLSFTGKNHFDYAVVKTDSSLVYRGKRKKWNAIHKLDKDSYYSDKNLKRNRYQKKGDEIYLLKDYIITKSPDGKAIEIKNQGHRRNLNIYTIISSDSTIFIYNNRYSGLKLENHNNSLIISDGRKQLLKYELTKR